MHLFGRYYYFIPERFGEVKVFPMTFLPVEYRPLMYVDIPHLFQDHSLSSHLDAVAVIYFTVASLIFDGKSCEEMALKQVSFLRRCAGEGVNLDGVGYSCKTEYGGAYS